MANFELTENTYIIKYTNDEKTTFENYYIGGPSGEGKLSDIQFPENSGQFTTYTSLADFNAELGSLKVTQIATDPFLYSSTKGCTSINDEGFCVD
tara:strand:- start:551 stop:835 length:285 start_codon:yes stop_codon:yes gene_type:complete